LRVIALVDGEHYPEVTRWGLGKAREAGYDVAAALLVGGMEKLGPDRRLDLGETSVLEGAADPRAALAEAISALGVEAVLDLSDEPVLGYEVRMELIAVTLSRGVPYIGPDFRFDPPVTEPALPVPTLAVIGTGKRVAKTAVAGQTARLAESRGYRPTIVAMGRGGPLEPVLVTPEDVGLADLTERAGRGEHAASDYLEDAVMAKVRTVGARRLGGGLAGRPFASTVGEAARLAASTDTRLVVLEGSGASVPTVPWDAGVLVVPASLPPEHLGGYLGPLRVLLSDLLVFIIDSGSISGPENLSALYPLARRLRTGIRVAIADLHPVPQDDVRGKDAFFATTSHGELAGRLADELERTAGCRVVSFSSNLADRAALERDLAAAPPFDVLLTELKAAAVDVAARRALERGAEVVFVDNRLGTVAGDGEVDDLLGEAIELARDRAAARLGGSKRK
jgi:cyclic 2,3-diphosphoglycerate synthetase